MKFSIYIEKNANHSVDIEFTLKFSEFVNSGIYVAIQYAAWPGRDIFFKVNNVDQSSWFCICANSLSFCAKRSAQISIICAKNLRKKRIARPMPRICAKNFRKYQSFVQKKEAKKVSFDHWHVLNWMNFSSSTLKRPKNTVCIGALFCLSKHIL